MYLKLIKNVNVGPIENATVIFPFHESGLPKPLVIVGENGTGKSALISNVVDALYEIAGEAYYDVRQKNDTEGYQYFKAISPTEIHIGRQYMYSYIEFIDSGEQPKIEYIFKSGKLTHENFVAETNISLPNITWEEKENYKKASITKKAAEAILSRDVVCYFGPERFEKPCWMGDRYYRIADFEHPRIRQKFAEKLEKPIFMKDMTTATLQWLLDVIVDSRCDIARNGEGLTTAHVQVDDLLRLGTARENIETIMSGILGLQVYFGLNFRNSNQSRFNIRAKENDAVVVPTLDSLSTGQSALFNMFATIVRYSDMDNITNSINLSEITGVVVIDEIELHLHTTLQREVLPKLIKLFPKVQFVITTHSPLFLLGMDAEFGDGYEIYQMPSATRITAERFSEFQRAYSYLSQTQKHEERIMSEIQGNLQCY